MRPLRSFILCGALAALLLSADTASAAWNNVFQVTLFHHRKPTTAQYYAPPVAVAPAVAVYSSPVVVAQSSPCCDPCQKTNCTTNYVQRTYYQPVTVMQTKTYYEPVTTVQTSYYYEPVVSYRYASYYDACSCSCQQVAIPTTSYALKAKSCPVQSWVQKSCQVPVTAYQKACYWEPQTTCCTTTSGPPVFTAPPAAGPPPAGPPPAGPPPYGPPPVTDQKFSAPPANGPIQQDKYYGPIIGESSQIKSGGWQSSEPALGTPVPAAKPYQPLPAAPKNSIPLDKFASLQTIKTVGTKGQVVSSSNAPRANAQLIFVPADVKGPEQAVTADAAGQFQVALASGQWNVYLRQDNGQPLYHSKVRINDGQPSFLTLVSR